MGNAKHTEVVSFELMSGYDIKYLFERCAFDVLQATLLLVPRYENCKEYELVKEIRL